ncbi:MAG: ABC transporter ATP-binding protein/permease, partial [Chloroflexota bacterium]|nr:ABC transporter ATP-binding protein/permease [Chloroflexota bacterium]
MSALWGSVAPYWRIVRLLPGVSRPLTLVVVIGVLVNALLPVAGTLATGALVGAVPAAVAAGPDSPPARTAMTALAVVGVLFVATRVLGSVRTTLAASLGRRLDVHLRERVMQALNRPAGIAHLEDPEIRDRIEHALDVSGGRWRAGDTVAPLSSAASAWLQSAGATLVLARFSVPLALGWFGMWVVVSHFIRRAFLRGTEVASNQTKFLRRADYLRQLVMAPPAAKEVRIWGLVDWLIDRFAEEKRRVLEPVWEDRARGHRVQAVTALGLGATYVLVLVAVGLAAVRGEITLAALATYVGAAPTVGAIILPGADTLALAHATSTVPPLLELERLSAEAEEREALRGTMAPAGMPRTGIRLEGVTFRYPGEFRPAGERVPEEGQARGVADASAASQPPVLQELDLFIPAGRSLAIVGENGAGKTTLVKLIARFYEPTEGRILVDDVDLRRMDLGAWRGRISTAFQDFARFEFLVRETVGVGDLAHVERPAAVGAALARAGATEVASSLPNGLETQLGRDWRGGVEISGGQWQRLALARAFMRQDPLLVVFDAPTAAIDAPTEHALFERFAAAARSGASRGTVTL